ncbi:Rv1355c family protein [Candidatus Mycobacterium methanotrophicum]|uniref:Rv1355c family protein n=1 Tax=Candidatus Mycobacterium methanotrophicum TaxID=2943498 RepID=A0ABY4QRJ0_9MYCO|nr:Rv1355c family protein [Candidatus Mycobacterium methanotrophicum]UQX12205.1 Rv1355c family protein [Candidatus Mycobacterium methanotrophicum]
MTIGSCTALVLDAADPADRVVLEQLRADPVIELIDDSERQLEELRKLLPPPDPQLVAEPFRWAYYPWRRTVVSVLAPRAFRAVRLDRNRNMITTEEQRRLGALRIGVAGLSVGHVIAHTLAAQGMCGELRLADFDHLELSNLNRVPATVLDLGVNKAELAARRIAELDPYVPVRVLDAGLTIDTVDEFLDGLDIVVEECDSLDMKVVVRQGARARGIPVLMATSDRGMVDVERFDCEPRRPILHGLLGDVDFARLPQMSSREKVPYLLRFLEADKLSPRLAASVVEIDRQLSTWPQLAGDVVLGATAVGEAVRRIGLGEDLCSGRARIDVSGRLDQLDTPEMTTDHFAAEQYSDPALPGLPGIVAGAALRAPSGGNAQPWHIDATPDAVTIRLAPQYTSMMDVEFRGSAVALGAALFNAKVAAASQQMLGPVSVREDVDGIPLQVTLDLRPGADPDLAALYAPMLARETNRRLGRPRAMAADTIELLHTIARREGARLYLLTSRDDIARAATILAATDRTRYLTPGLHAEIVCELRWPGDPCPDTGIDVHGLELDPGNLAALGILRRADVMTLLAQWRGGSALGEDTLRRIAASSAIAVISVHGGALTDYARGGAAVEAVWIAAQRDGLAVQPVSPVFLYARDADDLTVLSAPWAGELTELHREFRKLVGMPADEFAALVLRFAVSDPASVRSRRSVGRVHLLGGR